MPARDSAYLRFLNDPDQSTRRLELEAFFGPNAPVFLKIYERLRTDTVLSPTGRPRFSLLGGGFSAAAFFLGPVWFFYRKMWVIASVIVAVMVGIAFLPVASRAGIAVGVVLALLAHRTYVQFAIGELTKLRSPDGTLDLTLAARRGGVSRTAGAISATLYVLIAVLGIVSVIYLASHGVDPH